MPSSSTGGPRIWGLPGCPFWDPKLVNLGVGTPKSGPPDLEGHDLGPPNRVPNRSWPAHGHDQKDGAARQGDRPRRGATKVRGRARALRSAYDANASHYGVPKGPKTGPRTPDLGFGTSNLEGSGPHSEGLRAYMPEWALGDYVYFSVHGPRGHCKEVLGTRNYTRAPPVSWPPAGWGPPEGDHSGVQK